MNTNQNKVKWKLAKDLPALTKERRRDKAYAASLITNENRRFQGMALWIHSPLLESVLNMRTQTRCWGYGCSLHCPLYLFLHLKMSIIKSFKKWLQTSFKVSLQNTFLWFPTYIGCFLTSHLPNLILLLPTAKEEDRGKKSSH